MNLPNKLTVSRFVLTAAFLVVLFSEMPWHQTIALILFSVAGITDFLDGRIARQRNLITNFGILMDPLADKILTCSAFIAFVAMPETHMKAWMVVVIVSRELAITGLRLIAASKNLVLAAEGFGKHKTISQIVAIVAVLTVHAYPHWGSVAQGVFGFEVFGQAWSNQFAVLAIWVAVALTILSGSIYLWKNREVYLSDM
jgi:CDP-diacylglycerol--glycerol-3-phosphate 3-phosphatidyltransferase